MTKRDRMERLAAQAFTAWDLAEQGYTLREIAEEFSVAANYVWQLLEMHQRRRRARR